MGGEFLVSVVDEKGNCEQIDDFGERKLSHGVWKIDNMDGIDVHEFNETYKALKDNMNKKEEEKFAKIIFGKQVHYTPENIIDELIDFIEGDDILVLYNEEIVEYLVRKWEFPAENFTFVTDSLYRMTRLYINGIHCKMIYVNDYTEIEKEIKDMNFDYVISNPPYDYDLDVASAVLPHCKKGAFIHPATWALQNKPSKKFNFFNDNFADKISKIKFKWCNHIFNIGLFVPCSITMFDMNKNDNEIEVDDSDLVNKENHVYIAKNLKDITWYGEDFYKYEMKGFFERIDGYCNASRNLLDKRNNEKEFKIHLAQIRGHVNMTGSGNKSDFFSFLSLDVNKNNINGQANSSLYYSFDTEEERENFIVYLKSKFARFCLSYYKMNSQLDRGELAIVPWLDFKKHWNDKALKEHFNISNELYDYIDHFIPDYYSDYKFDM